MPALGVNRKYKGNPDEKELRQIDSVMKKFAPHVSFRTFYDINRYSLFNEDVISELE